MGVGIGRETTGLVDWWWKVVLTVAATTSTSTVMTILPADIRETETWQHEGRRAVVQRSIGRTSVELLDVRTGEEHYLGYRSHARAVQVAADFVWGRA